MIKKQILMALMLTCSLQKFSLSQTLEPGNKIETAVMIAIEKKDSLAFRYAYSVHSSRQSLQKVWQFYIISGVAKTSITEAHNPARWELGVPEQNNLVELRWGTPGGNEIAPGETLSGFSFDGEGVPGIVDYYAEGYHNVPQWPGPVEEDSIPGYDDLTPYGPGIVGKTVGPVEPPDLSVMTSILDTLISYKHQCLTLGWLKDDKAHKEDCDDMMKERNWYKRGEFEKFRKWEPDESWEFDHDWDSGIVRVLDRRLDKAKRELSRGDSVRARKDLKIFVMEVEMLNNLSKKIEARNKKSEVRDKSSIMTSEAYALLKYNAEYLIDRLPERYGKVDERRGKK